MSKYCEGETVTCLLELGSRRAGSCLTPEKSKGDMTQPREVVPQGVAKGTLFFVSEVALARAA